MAIIESTSLEPDLAIHHLAVEDLLLIPLIEPSDELVEQRYGRFPISSISSDSEDYRHSPKHGGRRIEAFIRTFGLIKEAAIESMISETDSRSELEPYGITEETRRRLTFRINSGETLGKIIFDKGLDAVPIEDGQDFEIGRSEVSFRLDDKHHLIIASEGVFWTRSDSGQGPTQDWQVEFFGQIAPVDSAA